MLEIKDQHKDSHSGQQDYIMTASLDGNLVGTLSYSVFKSVPAVSMIEVTLKRQGIGTALVLALQDKFPDTMIDFGFQSAEGEAFLEALEWEHQTNEEHAAAIHEHELISEKLEQYNLKAEQLATASTEEKEAFIRETADWNDLHDRADELNRIIENTPSGFRFIIGGKPKQPDPLLP